MGLSRTLTAEALGKLDESITTVVGSGRGRSGAGAYDATRPTGVVWDTIGKELPT